MSQECFKSVHKGLKNQKSLEDITHFDTFRILDYLRAECERTKRDETEELFKYADIFNFAKINKRQRLIVRSWSRSMYKLLEIDRLQQEHHSTLYVKFEAMHKLLKGASEKSVDKFLDTYIGAMLKNPYLKILELLHNTESNFSYHQYMFDEIILAICGQCERQGVDTDLLPKVEQITVDIAGRTLSYLVALAQTRVKKLSLTAFFAISDLRKFCARNSALVTLEINAFRFSDCGQLNAIVGHCPSLRELKFVMSDNARDKEYEKLAQLPQLRHLEIGIQPDEMVVDFGSEEDHIGSRQSRLGPAYVEDSTLGNPTPLLLLIQALSKRKKSVLNHLRLIFKVNDEVVQAIVKLKGLRMLECGFCHSRSIEHLAGHPTLKRLSIRERVNIITDTMVYFLRKNVAVSNNFTKLYMNPRGHLAIEAIDAGLLGFANFHLLLSLENLKTIWISKDLLVPMGRDLLLFLERGVEVIGICRMVLHSETRELKITYDKDYEGDEIPLPLVSELRSFKVFSNPTTFLFLENLLENHSDSLQEISILKKNYLHESAVVSLAGLSNLRKVSCGFRKFKYIQHLAELKELEEIEVISKHDPQEIPKSLVHILEGCRKLSLFKIAVPVSGINEAFVASLQDAVLKHRDADMQDDLDICLQLTESDSINQTLQALISGPFQLMLLRTEHLTISEDRLLVVLNI